MVHGRSNHGENKRKNMNKQLRPNKVLDENLGLRTTFMVSKE